MRNLFVTKGLPSRPVLTSMSNTAPKSNDDASRNCFIKLFKLSNMHVDGKLGLETGTVLRDHARQKAVSKEARKRQRETITLYGATKTIKHDPAPISSDDEGPVGNAIQNEKPKYENVAKNFLLKNNKLQERKFTQISCTNRETDLCRKFNVLPCKVFLEDVTRSPVFQKRYLDFVMDNGENERKEILGVSKTKPDNIFSSAASRRFEEQKQNSTRLADFTQNGDERSSPKTYISSVQGCKRLLSDTESRPYPKCLRLSSSKTSLTHQESGQFLPVINVGKASRPLPTFAKSHDRDTSERNSTTKDIQRLQRRYGLIPMRIVLTDLANDEDYKHILTKRLVKPPDKLHFSPAIPHGRKKRVIGRNVTKVKRPWPQQQRLRMKRTEEGIEYVESLLLKFFERTQAECGSKFVRDEGSLAYINRVFSKDRQFWDFCR